jgi:hypothetical protein
MLTLSYLELTIYSLGLAIVYVGAGIALSEWWHKPPPDPWARSSRDYEHDRFGSAMDGALSRIRWLPLEDKGEGRREN